MPRQCDMKYSELKRHFCDLNSGTSSERLTAHIIFTEESFSQKYPLLSRTHRITSDEKAYQSGMGGYSIFGSCLDGTDRGVRLERYMAEEGISDGWEVQDCYILEHMRDATAIPNFQRVVQDDSTVCFFFGDTCIQAHEVREAGKVRLEPVTGDQAACGEWLDLPIDRVYGYCELLEKHLNREART